MLSENTIQRLTRLGYLTDSDLINWQQIRDSLGEASFHCYLAEEEKAAEEYRHWFPRLLAFAAECRQAVPVPAVDDFSNAEREQYRVLLGKMQEFVESMDSCILKRKPNQAAILATTRVGLAAAQEVFGDTGAVILQQEEHKLWYSNVCPPDLEGFWWYSLAWWLLRAGLSEEHAAFYHRAHLISEGSSYWEVECGLQWGSLAGGANHEIWQWDGQRAEFIELYCVDTY